MPLKHMGLEHSTCVHMSSLSAHKSGGHCFCPHQATGTAKLLQEQHTSETVQNEEGVLSEKPPSACTMANSAAFCSASSGVGNAAAADASKGL